MQVIGEKGGKFIKKHKVKYTKGPIGKIKIVDDFLPKPKDLVLKEETKKITILGEDLRPSGKKKS